MGFVSEGSFVGVHGSMHPIYHERKGIQNYTWAAGKHDFSARRWSWAPAVFRNTCTQTDTA